MTATCARGCGRGVKARDLCNTHYRAALRAGQFQVRERDPIARFWSRVDRSGECWIWLGAKDPNGYGRVGWGGKVLLTHRVSYEIEAGPIPEGLPLDHLCRTPSCVRPDHLEAVTTRENTARGKHVSATALRTNRCVNGHEYTEENTVLWRGERCCRECQRIRSAAYRSKTTRKPNPRPSKVRPAEALCDICGTRFEYMKISRARSVCSDECRRLRNNRIKMAYKERQRAR